jgi:hypothetical protein
MHSLCELLDELHTRLLTGDLAAAATMMAAAV